MNAAPGFYRDRFIGFSASFFLHGALLVLGGAIFVMPAEYAVETGGGGVELSLIAAPTEVRQPSAPSVEENQETPLPQIKENRPQVQTAAPSASRGDGSSPVPGKDAVTLQSSGGAVTQTRPGYLRNPAPPYPRQARQKGWEGTVVLSILVDKDGHPARVEIDRSSGHEALDQAALNTVKRWRFRAARLGALPAQSLVRVPVRFQLKD